ncbi:MAG: hypothetical protein KDD66_15660 [Bdellovibrionales bacterium]|nr:hypothetical protein [Bdellovibrionales bacterium]
MKLNSINLPKFVILCFAAALIAAPSAKAEHLSIEEVEALAAYLDGADAAELSGEGRNFTAAAGLCKCEVPADVVDDKGNVQVDYNGVHTSSCGSWTDKTSCENNKCKVWRKVVIAGDKAFSAHETPCTWDGSASTIFQELLMEFEVTQ